MSSKDKLERKQPRGKFCGLALSIKA